jgi:hypothetical protein
MHKKILVEDLIKEGKLLVEALERIRFPITAAVWYDFPETQWMLVIVSPVVDKIGPMAAYGRIQRALQTVQPSRLVLSDISLIWLFALYQERGVIIFRGNGETRKMAVDIV